MLDVDEKEEGEKGEVEDGGRRDEEEREREKKGAREKATFYRPKRKQWRRHKDKKCFRLLANQEPLREIIIESSRLSGLRCLFQCLVHVQYLFNCIFSFVPLVNRLCGHASAILFFLKGDSIQCEK